MESAKYKSYDRYYWLIRKTICQIVKRKVNFSGESIPDDLGPLFILCNHNTDFDFILLMAKCKRPMDFVGTETMRRMGKISQFAVRKFDPILHDKGSKGMGTLKQIASRIKDGRSVLLFPEGNRSFDGRTGKISPAIGKIVKTTGATLVVYRLTGGYFTTPRWGKGVRKGRMNGEVKLILSPKEVASMDVKQLQKLIEEGLYTDAYAEQKENPTAFKYKAKAEYLESLLFMCPKCKKIGTLTSQEDTLSCKCGNRLTMDDYGYLTDTDNVRHTISEVFDEQKRMLKETLDARPGEELWSDEVQLCKLTIDHKIAAQEQAVLEAYEDHIAINDYELPRDSISSVDIVQRNRLIIHVNKSDVRYEFTGIETFNAVKYLIWYERSFDGIK